MKKLLPILFFFASGLYGQFSPPPVLASQADAEAGTNNTAFMSPLRTAQAIAAQGGGGGGGAPTNATYIVQTANGGLSAERVATDTSIAAWDFSTPGQVKLVLTLSSFNGAAAFTTLSASGQLTSTVATGTAPLVVASTSNVKCFSEQHSNLDRRSFVIDTKTKHWRKKRSVDSLQRDFR